MYIFYVQRASLIAWVILFLTPNNVIYSYMFTLQIHEWRNENMEQNEVFLHQFEHFEKRTKVNYDFQASRVIPVKHREYCISKIWNHDQKIKKSTFGPKINWAHIVNSDVKPKSITFQSIHESAKHTRRDPFISWSELKHKFQLKTKHLKEITNSYIISLHISHQCKWFLILPNRHDFGLLYSHQGKKHGSLFLSNSFSLGENFSA